jgi:hypothetical protein
MNLFQKAEAGHSFLKAGIMGLAGSGKTYTASSIAIGLVGYMKERGVTPKNSVAFVDTENGAAWLTPRFKEVGIDLMVARTRSLTDLRDAIDWAQQSVDVLIIDSITHFWTVYCEEYAKRKNRKRGLEFSDWNEVKREWRVNFTDRYLNSPLHIVMCGRQGYEYDMETNQAGKKELIKTGVKMKAEGETGFEPSLLIAMEQEQNMEGGELKSISRVATVLKDRSTKLDGKELRNPKFGDFLPHIAVLAIGGAGVTVDTTRDNAGLFSEEGSDSAWRHRETQKQIALEEIEAELVKQWPGQDKEAKQAKADAIERLFGTRSWTAVGQMHLDALQAARNALWLETRGHAYGIQPPPESPAETAAPTTEAAA